MPYWIYGHDAKNGKKRDPVFLETEDEADARRQAEEIGLIVEELEIVEPTAEAKAFESDADNESPKHRSFRANVDVILTTTPTIEGRPIKRYLGIVSGAAIVSAGAFAGLNDWSGFVGGRSTEYERELHRARGLAMDDIETAALAINANAVVGLQFEFKQIGAVSTVCVTGTAVVFENKESSVNHHITSH